jgi:hypothetical protein
MTEVATTRPQEREDDALLRASIQKALAMFPFTKRSPSHCAVSIAPTVSSEQSSEAGFYIEKAVIESIAETLSSQDAHEHERPEKMTLEIISNSYISDLPYAVEVEAVPPLSSSGAARSLPSSPMFFTCMGGSMFSTPGEHQSTGQDTTKSTKDNDFAAFCGRDTRLREPPTIRRATNLSESVAHRMSFSKERWRGRSSLLSWDNDDASRRTDKTEKHCNTSKEKKLEKMGSRHRSHTS